MERWRSEVRDVVDLYGQTHRFDVIAITDPILRTQRWFREYVDEIEHEANRAKRLYDLLVIPGAEVTQNHLRRRKCCHIVALNIHEWIGADRPVAEILEEVGRQGGVSIACRPHHRMTGHVEIGTCYLWNHRERTADLVDAWKATNLYSWKILLRCEKNWPAIAAAIRANVDVALTLDRDVTGSMN